MAGTKERAEGLVALVCESALIADSDKLNSVEGLDISSLQDRATCYVRDADKLYRFFESSTDAPAPPTIILPYGLTPADPGRWIEETGGGGGGSITSVVGSNGITTTNPAGPIVTVNGAALLPLDGTRAMTGNLDMGGNSLVEVVGVANPSGPILVAGQSGLSLSSAAGPLVLSGTSFSLDDGVGTGTAGQVLTADGAGNATWQASASASPGAPDRSIQFNNAGAFDGSASMLFDSDGTGNRVIVLTSGAATATNVGIRLRNSTGPSEVGSLYYNEATGVVSLSSSANMTVSAPANLLVSGGANTLVSGATGLSLSAGTPLAWPASDGSANDVMVTDGAGQLSLASISTIATPAMAIQNLGLNGNAADTFNTFVRCTAAGITVTLPAPTTPGKTIRVKDTTNAAGASPITVNVSGGANIDLTPTYSIATNLGSATFISNGTSWDVV